MCWCVCVCVCVSLCVRAHAQARSPACSHKFRVSFWVTHRTDEWNGKDGINKSRTERIYKLNQRSAYANCLQLNHLNGTIGNGKWIFMTNNIQISRTCGTAVRIHQRREGSGWRRWERVREKQTKNVLQRNIFWMLWINWSTSNKIWSTTTDNGRHVAAGPDRRVEHGVAWNLDWNLFNQNSNECVHVLHIAYRIQVVVVYHVYIDLALVTDYPLAY